MDRIKQLTQFLEASPDDCFLRHALALEYLKQDDVDHSAQYFEANLQSDPEYLPTYYHYGQLLERTEELEKALLLYQQGMEKAQKAGDHHTLSELRAVYEDLSER